MKSQKKIPEAKAMTEQALFQGEKRNGDREVDGVFESFEEIRNRLSTLLDDLNTEQNLYNE